MNAVTPNAIAHIMEIPLNTADHNLQPNVLVKDIQWKGTTGRICLYQLTVSDCVSDMEMGFSTQSCYYVKLNSLLRGKRQRLICGSIIQLTEFVVVATGTVACPDAGRLIVARKVKIIKREP